MTHDLSLDFGESPRIQEPTSPREMAWRGFLVDAWVRGLLDSATEGHSR